MGVGVFTIADENISDVNQAEIMFTDKVLFMLHPVMFIHIMSFHSK